MRHARLKPVAADTFMHVYNRTVGTRMEFPFGDCEKETFISRLLKLSELYVVEVIAYQLMSNHFHILVHVPAEAPSLEETAARFNRYYPKKSALNADSLACARLAPQLRDISAFMKDLQQPFTRWFNRTRPTRRRGHLWAERFKNTVLENGLAVWDCWKYIEMNPVRAHMVSDPADYRFCSFGHWSGVGRHPCATAVENRLLPWLRGLLGTETLTDVQQSLHVEFARIRTTEAGQTPGQIEAAMAEAGARERFTTQVDRRVRYWVDGLVIGSERFVRETMGRVRVAATVQKRRLVRALAPTADRPDLFCFKQLRILLE